MSSTSCYVVLSMIVPGNYLETINSVIMFKLSYLLYTLLCTLLLAAYWILRTGFSLIQVWLASQVSTGEMFGLASSD